MPAPIVAAAAAGARVAAQAGARAAVGAARVSGQAAKAGVQAAGRGAAAAARGGAKAATSGAARGGKAAAQGTGSAARKAGSATGHAGKQAAGTANKAGSGSQLPPRQGWGYQQPGASGASSARPAPGSGIDPGRMAKDFATRRLKLLLARRLLRRRRKGDKPKSKKDKLKAKLRKRRRWVRRGVVLAFALLLLFPMVMGGIGGAQMNDAMAASEDEASASESGFGLVSGIPYAEEFNKTAALGIDPRLVAAVAWVESSFDPDNVFCRRTSSAGAKGIMQLMPGTATALGVDPCTPPEAIDGGARYLLQQYETFGTWELALAAYNAGPGKVEAAGNKIPDIVETKAYVPKVLGKWDDYKQQFPGGSITGGGPPGGPRGGTARYTERGLPAVTQRLVDAVVPVFGRGYGLFCFGQRSGPSDHPAGKACDFMMARGGTRATGDDLAHGNALAAWLQANASDLGITYVIWQNRIWSPGRASEGWRHQHDEAGKSNSFLHYDHIHVSVN